MFSSRQAKLVGWFAIGALIVGFLMTAQTSLATAITFLILGSVVAFLTMHDVNCTVEGNCDRYAWIKAILVIGLLLAFAIVAVQGLSEHQNPFAQGFSWQVLWDPKARRKAVEEAEKQVRH